MIYLFLAERIKIRHEKCHKLVCNLHNNKKHVVQVRNLKQASNDGLTLKKVHRIIELNQKVWPKSHINLNKELKTEAKNNFEKDYFKTISNSVRNCKKT